MKAGVIRSYHRSQNPSYSSHNQSMWSAGHTDIMDVDLILDLAGESESENESDESDGLEDTEFDAAALAYNECDDIDAAVTMEQSVQELEAELYLEDQATFHSICVKPPSFLQLILIHFWDQTIVF